MAGRRRSKAFAQILGDESTRAIDLSAKAAGTAARAGAVIACQA